MKRMRKVILVSAAALAITATSIVSFAVNAETLAVKSTAVPTPRFERDSDFRGLGCGGYGMDYNGSYSDEELAKIREERRAERAEIRNEILDKRVKEGSLTQKEADEIKKNMEEVQRYHDENGYGYGHGMMGRGNMMGSGGYGGCRNAW